METTQAKDDTTWGGAGEDVSSGSGGCNVLVKTSLLGAAAAVGSLRLIVVEPAERTVFAPVGGHAHVGQYVGHVGRARELEVRALPNVHVVQIGGQRFDVHHLQLVDLDQVDQVVDVVQQGRRVGTFAAAERGRLGRLAAVHGLAFHEVRRGRAGRERLGLDQQMVVFHEAARDQVDGGRGMLVQLLVHLVVGHERHGRPGAEQHAGAAAVAVVVVFVVHQVVGGHGAETGAGRQYRDRGRRVQRVQQFEFQRLDVEARGRLVVESRALRRVGQVARRAGRHLGVNGRGHHAHVRGGSDDALCRRGTGAALGRVDGEVVFESVRVHRAQSVHLYDAVAADERFRVRSGGGRRRSRARRRRRRHDGQRRGARRRRRRGHHAGPAADVLDHVHRAGSERGRESTGPGPGAAVLLADVLAQLGLVRGRGRGLGDGRSAVLGRPLARPVLVVRVLLHVVHPEPFRLVHERFALGQVQQLPERAQSFRDLRVVHVRVLFAYLASLHLRPYHERVHRPFNVIRIVLFRLCCVRVRRRRVFVDHL
uniref:Uncharacterized protein n=1 Tax=Sipha flava TaxID=143950 RepID=A0A2S2Q1P0_9HEMI